jgi:hypothetical protein
MPAIGFGQTYNSGVKYIKINRYDSGGLDRSDYLGQLQSLTLTYPDRSAIEYPITTIQEQANFYLYGITPGYNTSSKGNINDYSFDADCGAYHPVVTGIDYYLTGSIYTWIVNNDPLNAFTPGVGNNYYTYPITPNIPVEFSFTASFVKISPGQIAPYVWLVNRDTMDVAASFYTSPITVPGATVIFTGSIILTGSYHPIENNSYIIAIGAQGSGLTTGNWNFGGLNWFFTQSNAPFNGSSSLTIFNPDALNFDYNDYNPLLGNAETPQYSTVWMDVDYSQNPLVPINFGLIISGTADRAFVQDSNYSSKAWSNLRYNGSRTTSYRINQ